MGNYDSIAKAVSDKTSPVYKSTNWQQIKKYLWQRDINVTKQDVEKVLEKQNFGQIKFKNKGLAKISETSKQYTTRAKFFGILQADTMVLSKKRSYHTMAPYVLVVVCQLSRYIFLESTFSLKFKFQKEAWENVFRKIASIMPNATVFTIISDSGVEFSLQLKSWLNEKKIKLNNVKKRPFRLSRGAPYCESAIRRVRNVLEKVMTDVSNRKLVFKDILVKVENILNSQKLSSINMSSKESLLHNANYLLMLSESLKIKRRKHLRIELNRNAAIPKFTIVRIKKFLEKEFQSSRKESYGFLSSYFMVNSIVKDRQLKRYELVNLFTLNKLPGTYSMNELLISKLSYFEACLVEERNILKVLKTNDKYVFYTVPSTVKSFIALKSLIE